jgi:hypothetical protein
VDVCRTDSDRSNDNGQPTAFEIKARQRIAHFLATSGVDAYNLPTMEHFCLQSLTVRCVRLRQRVKASFLLCACLGFTLQASAQTYQNWFNDPFFQISAADPTCPEPAGPFVDEESKKRQSHHRSEKGTTCWLAGECERPKAYLYDADIAEGIQKSLRQTSAFRQSTLWITVQGRVVYIEGCARYRGTIDQLEARLRAVKHVQQTSSNVRIDIPRQVRSKTPYPVRIKQ